MRTSHEIFSAIPDFARLFKKHVLPHLSHREKLNTRSSCQLFRKLIPEEQLLVIGKILPPLKEYLALITQPEKVTCYMIGETPSQMFDLINKIVYKNKVDKYILIEELEDKYISYEPESLMRTTKIQGVTLKIANFKTTYYFRNLFYSSDALYYLVCDISKREELASLSKICSEIKSYCDAGKPPVIILLAVKPNMESEEKITHTDLEEFVQARKITNWLKVDISSYENILKSVTVGLRYMMMRRHPAIKNNLEHKFLDSDSNNKRPCCAIC